MNRTIHKWIVSMIQHARLSNGFWGRRYSLPCTSICRQVGLLDFKFRRSVGPARSRMMRSYRFSGAKHSQLRRRTIAESLSKKYIFLGYGSNGAFGYRLWDPENKQVVIPRWCEQLSQSPERIWCSHGLFSTDSPRMPTNQRHMKKYRHMPIWPLGIWRWSRKWTPSDIISHGTLSNYRRINVLFCCCGYLQVRVGLQGTIGVLD